MKHQEHPSHVGFEIDFSKGYPQGYARKVQRAVFWHEKSSTYAEQLNALVRVSSFSSVALLLPPSSLILKCAQYLNSWLIFNRDNKLHLFYVRYMHSDDTLNGFDVDIVDWSTGILLHLVVIYTIPPCTRIQVYLIVVCHYLLLHVCQTPVDWLLVPNSLPHKLCMHWQPKETMQPKHPPPCTSQYSISCGIFWHRK